MSDWRHWHRRLFLAGAALLFLSLEAWARAGDGQRFSGGGGGWSSGTTIGGDGSSGVDIAYLIYLVVRYPAIGVPVLIVVLIVGYLKYQGQHRIETTIRNHNLQRHHAQRDANLAALQERDTTFELNAFKRRVQDGFERIQRAWAGGNIESVRPCMSDGVYERFNVQLELLRAAHQRNHMSGVQVDDVDVVAVTSDGQFDALHVAIRADRNRLHGGHAQRQADPRQQANAALVYRILELSQKARSQDPRHPGPARRELPKLRRGHQSRRCSHLHILRIRAERRRV